MSPIHRSRTTRCSCPYLENRSPLKYYGKAKIGSRPAKRTKAEKLDLKDLRAIPFVGSWSQIKQNVPGYYGIGTALRRLADSGRLEELKKAFQEVPFFRALILNSMMSLIKCNFGLTKYLSEDPEYGGFWKMLYDEYELSTEMTLLISGYSTLMEKEPVTRSSILIRGENCASTSDHSAVRPHEARKRRREPGGLREDY